MFVGVVALHGGCAPSCEQACRKLLACGLDSPRTAQTECESSCESQQALYEAWDDQEKLQAFDNHRQCLRASTCEDIAEGVCYEDELFVF